jgi:hypothetical protein
LDEHLTTSEHPYTIHALPQTVAKPLSKRQNELKEYAFANGWSFEPKLDWNTDYLIENTFFETRPIEYLKNRMTGKFPCNAAWDLVDMTFDEGALMTAEVHNMSMMLIHFNQDIPNFQLDKERLFNRLLDFAIKEDIDVAEDFDTRFSVKGQDRKAIKKFFTPELRSFIKDNDKYHIESTNNVILIFRYFRIMSISEIKELNSFGEQLSAHFHNCVEMPKEAP